MRRWHMDRQNITLSIDKNLLKQAKHLAVEKGTSLSGLLSRYLEELVKREAAYEQAASRIEERLVKGLDLGTQGTCNWTRDSLHER